MSNNQAENARRALERVCSGTGLEPASRYYSASFVDHTLGMLRQLGLARSLLVGVKSIGGMMTASQSGGSRTATTQS